MANDFGPIQYALCKRCDHFVDVNYDAEDYPDAGYCSHLHLDDGDQEFDHDAEPGEVHTGDEWAALRPDLFKEYPDGKVGPNSIHHSSRGKADNTTMKKYMVRATRTVEEEISVEVIADSEATARAEFLRQHNEGEIEGRWQTYDKAEPEIESADEK